MDCFPSSRSAARCRIASLLRRANKAQSTRDGTGSTPQRGEIALVVPNGLGFVFKSGINA
jgi:hypothetical protein